MTTMKTLGEFIIDNQNQFDYSTGVLSRLLDAIRLASKAANHEVNKAITYNFLIFQSYETHFRGLEVVVDSCSILMLFPLLTYVICKSIKI